MLRFLAAAFLLLAHAPYAVAVATIEDLQVPRQTVADRVFDATITLVNHGEAEDVVLVAALYDLADGKECGPATDGRFRGFTQTTQQNIHLAKDATVTYPKPGDRWSHRYDVGETPAGATGEWCVFVARAPGPTAQVQYEAYRSMRIGVRATNAAPTADFTWSPSSPTAAQRVEFQATATDEEGDPISLTWDFGFANASGRVRADNASPTIRFYPEGAFEVTLLASDGFDTARIVHTVAVLPEQAAAVTVTATRAPTPLPLWIGLVAVGLALARRHERDA